MNQVDVLKKRTLLICFCVVTRPLLREIVVLTKKEMNYINSSAFSLLFAGKE